MKKIIFILILIFSNLSATKTQLFNLYKNGEYQKSCELGFSNFSKYANDEEFITIYALGCVEADFIDRLAVPITSLKYTKEARANSSYFATILFQKKLLYQALKDGYDISHISLPTTEYVLSVVFDLYKELEDKNASEFLLEDKKDSSIKYRLYMKKDARIDKMVIEKIKDDKVIQKHIYW
ncbi:MAG: hypothetical protein WC144_06505 [Sulfurimonas sp.]|jgi:hypothetical protein|nr:hypothetical protein [Sulfurimonadaceae bacterium]